MERDSNRRHRQNNRDIIFSVFWGTVIAIVFMLLLISSTPFVRGIYG